MSTEAVQKKSVYKQYKQFGNIHSEGVQNSQCINSVSSDDLPVNYPILIFFPLLYT